MKVMEEEFRNGKGDKDSDNPEIQVCFCQFSIHICKDIKSISLFSTIKKQISADNISSNPETKTKIILPLLFLGLKKQLIFMLIIMIKMQMNYYKKY